MSSEHSNQVPPLEPSAEERQAINALTDEQREMADLILRESGLQPYAYSLISPPEETEEDRKGHASEKSVSVYRVLATCIHFWNIPPDLTREGIMLQLQSQEQTQGQGS